MINGPYYSNWGPLAGPILAGDDTRVLVVFDAPGAIEPPIGLAYPLGVVERQTALVRTFRIAIGSEELAGKWTCEGRRFLPLTEAAE